jgi:cysteine desulfurase
MGGLRRWRWTQHSHYFLFIGKKIMRTPIYLDYNATTPHDPDVIAAMKPFLTDYFGNPSSSYRYGVQTKEAVADARRQVSSLLRCDPTEIVFTSGGTESNNYAIKGAAFYNKHKGNHIITTEIEHPSVLEVCKFLETIGFQVSYLPVDDCGIVRIADIEKAITPETILITVMHANNEVGSIQPMREISNLGRNRKILIHTDAAQSIGKIPTDVQILGVDLLSIAGHKIYAPKGIGALYVRRGVQLSSLIHGAGQEKGMRPGTENVLEIVGLGKACEIAQSGLQKNMLHMKEMRERLFKEIDAKIKDVRRNGHPDTQLPNTLSLSFKDLEAHTILSEIEDRLAVSAGAACHSDRIEVSHVLKAMKLPGEWARGTLRFSTGKMSSQEEMVCASEIISEAVAELLRKKSAK